jgi:hypothetical protein
LITARRGMGDRRVASPILRRPARVGLAASGRGKTKGRSPVAWELRAHDRSRCAEHGEVVSMISEVCAPHRGQSWSHYPRSRAKAKATLK